MPYAWRLENLFVVNTGTVSSLRLRGNTRPCYNVVEFAGTDPVQHWRETEEEQTRRDNPGYERVRMASTTFRGRPAGYWEFTFDGTARKFRAAELAFASDDGTQYVIYLSAPNAQWHEYRPVFENATNGARVNTDKP